MQAVLQVWGQTGNERNVGQNPHFMLLARAKKYGIVD
jgi:hypothetical protein